MSFISPLQKQQQVIETKVIMTTLFYLLGVPLTFLGIVENYGSWKADILFVLSGILIGVKIVYFAIDKDQQRRKKQMDLEFQRYELNKKKNS